MCDTMSERTNSDHNPYNRIHSLVERIGTNLRSIDISWIGRRRQTSSSAANESIVEPNRGADSQSVDDRRRRESSQSLFGSANSSQTQSPTNGQQLSRPPHSHLYRHSSHYPLLFGSYNNWSFNRDNRLLSHINNNSINGDKERNVLSAIMSIVVIATLATALAQPKWFSITGGVCTRKYIGLQEFFYVSNFNNYHFDVTKGKSATIISRQRDLNINANKESTKHFTTEDIILYGMTGDLKNCVTPEIVTLQRTIIGLCFLAIMFNLIQFFFDTLGVHKKWLNAIRAHALGNILGVLLCVVIIGVSYLVSNLLEKEQRRLIQKSDNTSTHHIEVKFELSYYLVTLSGLLAIIAAASNLLRKPQHYYIDPNDPFWSEDIDDELTSTSTTTSPNWHPFPSRGLTIPSPPPPHPSASVLPPPPPYTP